VLFFLKITQSERLREVTWEEDRLSIGNWLYLFHYCRSASFKLPYNVREEWASKGLEVFTSKRYQDALDVVAERIGVSTSAVEHNVANQILLDGCEK
jgi:hypothetical protein